MKRILMIAGVCFLALIIIASIAATKQGLTLQAFSNPRSGPLVTFSLPKASKVSLEIYDITGKKVMNLLENQYLEAGEHTYSWDGTNEQGKQVSSGIYFVILRTAEGYRSLKLTYIKPTVIGTIYVPEIQNEEDTPCDECEESSNEMGTQQVIVKPVGAQKAKKFWSKARKNRDFRRVYEFIIAHDYVPIKRGKGAEDTLVYYVQSENYEGIVGFMSFTEESEEPTSEAELMYGELECTDSLGTTDSITIAQPFAFYFGERPQGIQCELFAADSADTVWIGEVGGTKFDWKTWLKCVGIVGGGACIVRAIWCIFAGPSWLACWTGFCGWSIINAAISCAAAQWLAPAPEEEGS